MRRIAARIVLLAGLAVVGMCVALFVGMRVDDHRIDAHLGTATATVLTVSSLHTGIEFVDAVGATIRPPGGVLYPGLLEVGQQFVVEYDLTEPTLVRVAGRTAAVGNLLLGLTFATTIVLAAALIWWLRRPGRLFPWRPATPSGRSTSPHDRSHTRAR